MMLRSPFPTILLLLLLPRWAFLGARSELEGDAQVGHEEAAIFQVAINVPTPKDEPLHVSALAS